MRKTFGKIVDGAADDIHNGMYQRPSPSPPSRSRPYNISLLNPRNSGATMGTQEKLATITEVAEHLNCSTRTVRRCVDRGDLICVRLTGRSLRFRWEDVHAFVASSIDQSQNDAQALDAFIHNYTEGGGL
ncbi:MAG: DNA-binding protein [Planctomycetota bacterium]|nr:MAG: DNA-binding protein [Planctomycetota bacterium]